MNNCRAPELLRIRRWRPLGIVALALGIGPATLASPASAQGVTTVEPARETFSLRAADPEIGSHLPRRLTSNSAIPLDKRWEDLSAAHQKIWSQQYQRMGPDDEPPFPRRGLQSIYRAFDLASKGRVSSSGVIDMEVMIDSQGVPQEVRVITTPGADATRVMAAVLLSESFKPALCRGQPCAMAFPVRFELHRKLL